MSDAVEQARDAVNRWLTDTASVLQERDDSVERTAYGAAQCCGIEPDLSTDPPTLRYTATNAEEVERLLAAADSDPIAWDALAIVAADLVERGSPLPRPLGSWAAKALRGNAPRPRKKISKHVSRDFIIYRAAVIAVDAGLQKSRNDQSSTVSAFDVVADCLKHHGIPAGYDTVKQIWRRYTSVGAWDKSTKE